MHVLEESGLVKTFSYMTSSSQSEVLEMKEMLEYEIMDR